MFGYPFKSIYLKTQLSRTEIESNLRDQTFLSDANFKNNPEKPKLFYGEISSFDFKLEHISKQQLSNFVKGEIKGVENDMYVHLRLGALDHQRIYFMFVAVVLVCLAFIIDGIVNGMSGNQIPLSQNPLLMALVVLEIMMFCIIYIKYRNFKKTVDASVNYFCNLWTAKTLKTNEVPIVFKL